MRSVDEGVVDPQPISKSGSDGWERRIDEVQADHGDFGDAIVEDESVGKERVVHARVADEVLGKRDFLPAGASLHCRPPDYTGVVEISADRALHECMGIIKGFVWVVVKRCVAVGSRGGRVVAVPVPRGWFGVGSTGRLRRGDGQP